MFFEQVIIIQILNKTYGTRNLITVLKEDYYVTLPEPF
jgi:hypothetical protein